MHSFLAFAMTVAVGADPQTDLFYHDFRNGQFRETLLKYVGPNVKSLVKPEAEGLRITLPTESKPTPSVGVACALAVHGDFEITVSYEVLRAGKPQSGYGMGVRLQIAAVSAKRDGAAIARAVHPAQGEVYSTARWFTADGKVQQNGRHYVTASKHGKMRLARKGDVLLYLAAGPDGENFLELRRETFVEDALNAVRIVADTGDSTGDLDVRIHDFRIRGSEISADPSVTRAGKAWIWWTLAGTCTAAVVILAWYYVRQRRAAEETDGGT